MLKTIRVRINNKKGEQEQKEVNQTTSIQTPHNCTRKARSYRTHSSWCELNNLFRKVRLGENGDIDFKQKFLKLIVGKVLR
jgi:hypothetical protein